MSPLLSEFARFPDSWEVVPFTQVVKDGTSGNIKIAKQDYLESGIYPIVDQGQNLYGGFTDEQSGLCKSELPTIIFGDHTRAFKFINEPFVIGADGAKVLEPKTKKLDKKFLFYYLKQLRIESAGYSRHFKFLKETYVPVPPLAEQKRIAAILDKADAIRQKRQQTIKLADEFLRSVFLEMFGDPVTNPKGWEVCELSSCLDFLTSGSRGWAKYYVEEGSKFIRIQNVGKNKLLLNELAYVNAPDTKEAERTRVKVNDVLLSITADLGRSAVVTEELSGGHINQHLALLRLKTSKLEPQFLSALLSSEGALQQFKAKNKAAVKAGLNFDDIRTFEVYLPPLRTQSKYLAIYNTAMKNLNKLMIHHDNTEVLFSSLSQKAFSGQL
ncbi:restriction endonuclease subunit S [Vibrio spartinae]|uniref:EcoKI restriction-modification system protein HsdS n=1 Tax=Vibrio spartinae TaxID=1918945 RepID=A0ABX6R5Q8_9VIBR|nr:restriction endonuclease subunit S [Vibrio spartinae]QMV16904.1 EcoKI restriction-modification system protein HsdS [Vibrio spartinae]